MDLQSAGCLFSVWGSTFARRGCHPDVDRGGSIKDGPRKENITLGSRVPLDVRTYRLVGKMREQEKAKSRGSLGATFAG